MDLLFKRYANPFLLLDNLIITGRFIDFIKELINTYNDEQIYDVWIHKVFDKSLEAFKDEIMMNCELANVDESKVESTIKNSMEILNDFNPYESEGGEI